MDVTKELTVGICRFLGGFSDVYDGTLQDSTVTGGAIHVAVKRLRVGISNVTDFEKVNL